MSVNAIATPSSGVVVESRLHTAEFVFPGHPDKLSDAVADAIVEAAHALEPRGLVGVEVAVHRQHVFVTGRIAAQGARDLDVAALVRDVYRSAGYDRNWFPAPEEVVVHEDLCREPLLEGEDHYRECADDQCICIGHANDLVATDHQPVEQWFARRMARALYALRGIAPLELGPDGKVIVAVREQVDAAGRRTWTLESFSASLQKRAGLDEIALQREVQRVLAEELQRSAGELPGFSAAMPARVHLNGAGAFELGGPDGDNGLSGKKLVVDAYGTRVPIGGGAWSGKDFFKADRAGGMHARRLARLAVQLGLAREVTVMLGWFPGDRVARVLDAVDGHGRVLDLERLALNMDLTLRRSGETFSVPGLVEVARWGHFADPTLPWERRLTL